MARKLDELARALFEIDGTGMLRNWLCTMSAPSKARLASLTVERFTVGSVMVRCSIHIRSDRSVGSGGASLGLVEEGEFVAFMFGLFDTSSLPAGFFAAKTAIGLD
ncbi:MAG: hypothetical protein DLM73_14040 [Chthoniobacterales bacterium]|nr:MAG: hypothetical protein DLM73_14040 [Chthoniobacterales bacterium]